MSTPLYLGIEGARQALAEMGVNLTPRQIKRAADPDANGKRKLPFFVEPITRRLCIEKSALLSIYSERQALAQMQATQTGQKIP